MTKLDNSQLTYHEVVVEFFVSIENTVYDIKEFQYTVRRTLASLNYRIHLEG